MRCKKKTITIGITGSLGTGKTTVAKIFKALGAVSLDADKIAHGVFKKDALPYKEIVKAFGRRILNKSGRIDRVKLGRHVFRNKRALNKLCNIVHPVVIGKIKESISKLKSVPAIVIDAPLLIEAGLHKIVDYLIVVKTSRATQIKRARKKTRLSAGEIKRRIRSQVPLSKKIKLADYVIDNEGEMSDTKKDVKKIWKEINSHSDLCHGNGK